MRIIGHRKRSVWRAPALILGVAAVCLASACAARAPKPVVTGPMFPAYEFPALSESLAASAGPLAEAHREAWNLLQSGNARAAARRFGAITRDAPDFYPADAGLGYSALAQQNYGDALTAFDKALATAPDYIPALLGRAEALLATSEIPDAVAALDAVVTIDPARTEVRTRADALRFQGLEELVADARDAQQKGQLDVARGLWQQAVQASPDSAFLYRELAAVERQAGQLDRAAEHVRTTLQLDPRDVAAHVLAGEIEEARGNATGALAAFKLAQSLEARPEIAARIAALGKSAALAALPEAYRSLPAAPQVTRGEVAAVLGLRLEKWLATAGSVPPVVMTDIRSHWAQPWILAVTRSGLMEVYPNHTFQPGTVVRRTDMADIIARALAAVAQRDRTRGEMWRNARPTLSDVPPTHASYPTAALAVASGVLKLDAEQSFQPTRPVTGAEALAVADRLADLLPQP